jgi:hypothetical protein
MLPPSATYEGKLNGNLLTWLSNVEVYRYRSRVLHCARRLTLAAFAVIGQTSYDMSCRAAAQRKDNRKAVEECTARIKTTRIHVSDA